ncbi:hypothetical protein SAMN04488113_12124 [Alkalibacterium gilvum]|uniref:DUF8173 domain-containing protein n=1 Tax=Alkalibacterium gilvum TaxID=1130080 RepID=A0A1H6TJM6_9LACT|nr:hypothetical protein [Alkalibacterium gilvum]SEI80273.1 hypothetical protein SAMN04488113_12124 [Alkalibacterium gilvum]
MITKNKSKSNHLSVIIFFIISFISLAGTVSATTLANNNQTSDTLEQGQTIDGPGFFYGEAIQIDGNVDGTTFVFGEQVQVNGDINGSLFIVGESVQIRGEVNGNIYGVGETIRMDGTNNSDVFMTGKTVRVEQNSVIGRDLFIAGMDVIQSGSVPRHLFGAGESVILNSSVGGDATIYGEEVTLNDSASIEGNFTYNSPNEADISQNARIAGQTYYTKTEPTDSTMFSFSQTERWMFRILFALFSLISALIVWLFIRLLRPQFWMNSTKSIATIPLKTMGFGLLALIATPLVTVLLMVTIIGIPMGIILSALYWIALYIAKIIVALFIGSQITKAYERESLGKEFLHVTLGLFILELLMLIPYVGWIIALIVAITGLGALVTFSRKPVEPKHAEYY